MNFSVTKKGQPLSKHLYEIDIDNKTFYSNENCLVLDFTNLDDWSFIVRNHCTLITGNRATIKAKNHCTFITESFCKFQTGHFCVFKTHSNCSFKTINSCTFDTSDNCKFNTGYACTFNTADNCVFKTEESCAFKINWGFKKIKTNGNSIIVVHDGRLILDKPIYAYLFDDSIIYYENKKLFFCNPKKGIPTKITKKEYEEEFEKLKMLQELKK